MMPTITQRTFVIALAIPRTLPADRDNTCEEEVLLIREEESRANVYRVTCHRTNGLMPQVL